jgi:O-succinylbenzoate synthase
MDLAHVELLHLRVPLVRPFASARGSAATKDVLLVHLRTADGVEGWGECAAEAAPTYAPEHVAGAWLVLAEHLVPRVRRGERVDAIRGHHMAKAALEMAWLDACGRRTGTSLAALVGGRPGAALPVGVVVEMHDDPSEVARRAAAHAAEGYRRVKVKIAPGNDRAVVRAVRDACAGGDVALWADANGSYPPDAGAQVAALDVDLIEQPFAAGDLVDHAAFLGAVAARPRVSLDESIDSVHTARAALALHAADSLVIKPGRLGGLHAAIAVHDSARAAGVPVWCGGMLETGIGRAANLAVASLPGFTLPGDLSASDRYVARDVTVEPFVLGPGGTLRVPDGPGLGVEVDEPYVRSLAVRTATI